MISECGSASIAFLSSGLVEANTIRAAVGHRLRSELSSTGLRDARRGKHAEYVFAFKGKPIRRMLNSAWKKARARAGLDELRVHDLKHTFGRRLRAAGVGFEDRQDLLGHRSGRITTHYSAADLSRLIEATNSVVERDGRRPELVVLRGELESESRKIHARGRADLVGAT